MAEREEFDPSKDVVVLDLGKIESGDQSEKVLLVQVRRYDGGEPKLALTYQGKKRSYPAKRIPLPEAVKLVELLSKNAKKISALGAE